MQTVTAASSRLTSTMFIRMTLQAYSTQSMCASARATTAHSRSCRRSALEARRVQACTSTTRKRKRICSAKKCRMFGNGWELGTSKKVKVKVKVKEKGCFYGFENFI